MKQWIAALLILTTVVALCGCSLNINLNLNNDADGSSASTGTTDPSGSTAPTNPAVNGKSYTVDAEKAMAMRNNVVATVPGAELTNGVLQIYYWTQVYEFLNDYGYYLSYVGLDLKKPLDQQQSGFGGGTWQEYFLESALDAWSTNVAFELAARQAGHTMNDEYRSILDNLPEEMQQSAVEGGYASIDAMLQDSMGPGCVMEDYMVYMETYYMGYSYFEELYAAIDPTMEQIDAYFEENQSSLAQNGITKDSGYTVDIRHILIRIEKLDSDTTENDGELIDGYSQVAWDACYAKAESILNQWLSGEATEEAFAELAKLHSADGNASEGGIYTGVEKDYMVETFDAWCFDETRLGGDYGIVRTKYGYHIMYFISKEDMWITASRKQLITQEANAIMDDILEQYPIQTEMEKVALGVVEL